MLIRQETTRLQFPFGVVSLRPVALRGSILSCYFTHYWGGLVSARVCQYSRGACELHLLGSNLLREPLQFSLRPQGTHHPWYVAGRHCRSLAGVLPMQKLLN